MGGHSKVGIRDFSTSVVCSSRRSDGWSWLWLGWRAPAVRVRASSDRGAAARRRLRLRAARFHQSGAQGRSVRMYGRCRWSVLAGKWIQHSCVDLVVVRAELPCNPPPLPFGAVLRIRQNLEEPPERLLARWRTVVFPNGVFSIETPLELIVEEKERSNICWCKIGAGSMRSVASTRSSRLCGQYNLPAHRTRRH